MNLFDAVKLKEIPEMCIRDRYCVQLLTYAMITAGDTHAD